MSEVKDPGVLADASTVKTNETSSALGRRGFLGMSAAGVGAALLGTAACGDESAPSRPASTTTTSATGPETPDVRLGMIALTDCAPIVIAHEKGFFRKHGINATIVKGASWAAIRDSLSNGSIHGTHMLLGMPIASTMGLLGSPRLPMVVPWLLNRNGQAITLAKRFKGTVAADPAAMLPLVQQAKARNAPLTFAMTFPPGTHAMWMRYWLAAGGIHPDRDVALVTIPPPQMVANMRVDRMDGFCVGEPWNARAIADDIGYTAITTQEMWKDHPEKVLAFREDFAAQNPRTVKAMLKAMHEASLWLDVPGNRAELAQILSRTTYVNCAPEVLLPRLLGQYDYGDGRRSQHEFAMTFQARNTNRPQEKYAVWWLTQFRRWGMVTGAPDYRALARKVMRGDLYDEAMRELGYAHGGASETPETFFDGRTFDPAQAEAYATSFTTHAVRNG
jgi:nitrate/nitrite transport system substrate-binding protein